MVCDMLKLNGIVNQGGWWEIKVGLDGPLYSDWIICIVLVVWNPEGLI